MSANLQKIINFLNTTNKNVLEIGSGSGEIANYFSNNNNVTTVDPCVSEYENKNITHHKTFFDDNYPNIKYDFEHLDKVFYYNQEYLTYEYDKKFVLSFGQYFAKGF